MTPEEYAASQALITAGLASYVRRVAGLFTGPSLSLRGWLDFLRLLFPEVQKRYEQSASLGRNFYDQQRKKHHPDLVENERFLTELKFEWFVQNMEPARKEMSQEGSPPQAVAKAVLTAVREVEMAGRRQVIGAVKNDPILVEKLTPQDVKPVREKPTREDSVWKAAIDNLRQLQRAVDDIPDEPVDDPVPDLLDETRPVIGWARVATGRETCAWCLALISRGAFVNHKGNFAYRAADTAGLDLEDETAIELWKQSGGDLSRFKELLFDDDDPDETVMNKWHTGCDCIAVPVFDLNDWPGRDQAARALQLWIDASKEAKDLIEAGKSRTKNMNKETLNALRRRLERGDISMSNYAIAA